MDDILQALKARDFRKEGVFGIRRAYDYVHPFVACVGNEACQRSFFPSLEGQLGAGKLSEMLKASEQHLVYSNQDTLPDYEKMFTSTDSIKDFCKQIEVEAPTKSIMVFANVITTPKKDRDGDRLRTEGATVDKSMPLLWHHMLPMPIGKMLKVLDHTKDRLLVASAIIDSPMGNDAAQLVEFGALRISHGFRPTKYELLSEKDGGFDILEYEIMEESTVSVPSNTDAVITAFARGKLHDPTVKSWAKSYHDARPVQVAGATLSAGKEGCSCKSKDAAEEARKEILELIKTVLKENPQAPYGHCVTCGSVLDDTSTCTNSNCGQIQSTLPETKVGRVLSGANMKKLEQAKAMIEDVLAAAVATESYDTEDEEMSPGNRTPNVADAIQFVETADRSTLAVLKQILDRRDHVLEDQELLKNLGIVAVS